MALPDPQHYPDKQPFDAFKADLQVPRLNIACAPQKITRKILKLRAVPMGYKDNYFTEMCCGSEEGSYLRLIDLCITQL